MRRVVLAVAVCLGVQLIQPTPAQAWWGWWDELSGPKFWGWEIETRLVCLGGEKNKTTRVLLESARRQVNLAFELFEGVQNSLPPKVDRSTEMVGDLATLAAAVEALTPNTLATAPNLIKDTTSLAGQVERACPLRDVNEDPCKDKASTLKRVRETLTKLASTLEDTVKEDTKVERFGSAGVALSACPFEKDENRRASIDLTYRLLWSYGDTKPDFAGGNEVRLSTFTPGMSWRPLKGIADGKADYVDLGAGAGIYWLTSDGARPGGFDTITGMILEPLRIDVHGPSVFAMKPQWWAKVLSATSFRFGLTIFPAGFDANAFGVTEKPEQSERIMGEWVHHFGLFFDPIRAVHLLSGN